MKIITSGQLYIDIDAYACIGAYKELLELLGENVVGVSSAPLNESITPSLQAYKARVLSDYAPTKDDTFVVVDLSDPSQFDVLVDPTRVVEVFDHHTGFETYWSEHIGRGSHIEFIGAAATLIYEAWKSADRLAEMSKTSAELLTAAILDNTLNFGAGVTTQRDKDAYAYLSSHAGIDDAWVANYFMECQQGTVSDLAVALRNDTKYFQWKGLDQELSMGQIVVWDAKSILANDLDLIAKTLQSDDKLWLVNLVSIADGKSYFIAESTHVQDWLMRLIGVRFEGKVATADHLWLRKEILKLAQQ